MRLEDLGLRLKMERIKHGLTQDQLGKRIHITKSRISTYENDILPSVDFLAKVAVVYNVTIDYLLGNENERRIVVQGLTDEQIISLENVVNEYRKMNEQIALLSSKGDV